MSQDGPLPREPNAAIFRRLLPLLRPYRAEDALGVTLLILSGPCELFPAFVWRFVTDDLVLQKSGSRWMRAWFSFGGEIESRLGLLVSSITWLLVVFLMGELLGSLDTWILKRVAQKFILNFRNRVYESFKRKASPISSASAPAI